MKKRFWVSVDPFRSALVTAAIEAGADALVLPSGYREQARRLGRISTVSEDGDLRWGRDVERVYIRGVADEQRVRPGVPTVVDNADWTIIPLENLLARGAEVIQTVRSAEQAALALEVMEQGAAGVLLVTDDPLEVRRTGQLVQSGSGGHLALALATVEAVRPVTLSDRCCVDTTSLFGAGEGLLVGNSANAMLLVHSENLDNGYCASRPFRVNAGAVHAYVIVPGGRTAYLAELAGGDEVLAVGADGESRVVAVGRNKIERRPMLLVEARSGDGRAVSLVLQNAETVCLVGAAGEPQPVTALQVGDGVLAWFGDSGGRHFGMALQESVEER